MKRKVCKFCGVRLTRQNAYISSQNKHRLRKICIECHNKLRIERTRKRRSKSRPILLKAINREQEIRFDNYIEKRRFVIIRKLQNIGHRPAIGFCSRVGQRVEHIVEERDKDNNVHRFYQEMRCSECSGLIRFDERGFKACVECGLLTEVFTLENELQPGTMPRDLRSSEYYSHARQDNSSQKGSA